jgi:hypothetical protein
MGTMMGTNYFLKYLLTSAVIKKLGANGQLEKYELVAPRQVTPSLNYFSVFLSLEILFPIKPLLKVGIFG